MADTVASLLGGGFGLLSIALPIGISFYTFQTMSYVIDVYRGKVAVQKNLIIFACYVTLFPQLIAGPIVRYSDVEVQLKRRTTTAAQLAEGVRRFTIGFAKKVLLANQVYVIWKELSAMQTLSVGAAWLGAVAFTFQIYFDFSGYSDMAIGLGKVFGFDYLENFDYPYISRSITEFWRRWHMSLSSWFKEYVYIPLGGNRKGLRRQIFNIALVWALTGLWHGASWNFVVWGVYYGALLIIEKLWLLKWLNRAPAAVGHIYSMLTVIIGWVIFAEENFGEMGRYLSMLFGAGGCLTDDAFFYYLGTRAVLLAVCVLAATPFPAKLGRAILCRAERLDRTTLLQGLLESASMLAVLCLSMAFLVSGSYNPFLYFRF